VTGLLIGLGIGQLRLGSERKAGQAKVRELVRKVSFLQRQYGEQRELRISSEDLAQSSRAELDKMREENRIVSERVKRVADENRKNTEQLKSLDAEKRKLSGSYAELKSERDDMEKKYGRLLRSDSMHEKELKHAAAENQALTAEVKRLGQGLDRCSSNNASLVGIADELIGKYKGKGVLGAIMEKEPLTQIRKVELDRLAQEYRDKIDQQRYRKK
jgi:chromosome segregation ATPase